MCGIVCVFVCEDVLAYTWLLHACLHNGTSYRQTALGDSLHAGQTAHSCLGQETPLKRRSRYLGTVHTY